MKFKSLCDVQMFLAEINTDLLDSACENFEPTEEMIELFIKKRKRLIPKMKDFQKSQASKQMWRKNRYSILKGIKSFHKSTAGKRMHRNIGRFLALRDTSKRETHLGLVKNPLSSTLLLKSLSSCETHNYIELEYYRKLTEEAEYQAFSDILQLRIYSIKESVTGDGVLSEKDLDFLISLVPTNILIDELCKLYESKTYSLELDKFNQRLEKLEDKEDYIYLTSFNELKYEDK